MPELVTLTEDSNLGPAGAQVWVDDPADIKAKPAKKAAKPDESESE
jgi:hypothetical protein